MFKVQTGKIDAIGQNIAVIEVSVRVPEAKRKNHSILMLDCSASMTDSIEDVRKDGQKYVSELTENDFVSLIIFSGHGQARLIAGPTQCNAAGKEMLGRAIRHEVKILNTTVFSEPLEISIATVKKLSGPGIVHNAVLFTDGCPVPTRWSNVAEEAKSYDAARTLSRMGCVVSVVGYGVYYDEKFINRLIMMAGNEGIFRHISEIEDFGDVIGHIRETFSKTVISNISLAFSSDGLAGRVFKTTPQLFVSSEIGKISMRGLYEGKAKLFIELTKPASFLKIAGEVNGKPINETLQADKLSPENAADYVRVAGAAAFLKGDYAFAAQMLSLVDDEWLAEKAANAFTDRETRETADTFRRYFVDRKFIGAGLKPTGPSHCVLNVIRTLIEDPENIVYMPSGVYKRSGLLTADPNVIESPLGRTLQVVNYVSHDNRFNFSLLCLKDVKVKPKDGGRPVDMKIYRAYNVVLDGNLHLPELEAVLSQKSFDALQEAGVIDAAEHYDFGKAYTINLRNLKMISPNWANPTNLGLVNLLREEADLKVQQTALNARIKELKLISSEAGALTPGGIYNPKSEIVKNAAVEYYTAPCCEYRLMKYKPAEYYCDNMSLTEAEKKVKEVRQRLSSVRFLIRAITFAMEMVKSNAIKWDGGVTTKRGEWPKLEQTATFLGAELKRVTWQEQCACS